MAQDRQNLILPSDNGALVSQRDVSLNQITYESLKQAILDSHLRPGNKLTHESLAQLLGVSRTPIREALERLYQEGFLVKLPRRGFFVAEIGVSEARELYELREAVETHCLALSMSKGLTNAQLNQLEELNNKYCELLKPNGTRDRLVVDRDFHMMLARFAGNQLLLAVLDSAFERLILKISWDGFSTVRGIEAYKQHKTILKSLRTGNTAQARKFLAHHIKGACTRLLDHMCGATNSPFEVPNRSKITGVAFDLKVSRHQ